MGFRNLQEKLENSLTAIYNFLTIIVLIRLYCKFGYYKILKYAPQYYLADFSIFSIKSNYLYHGLRTPRESFFSKILNFWAWADILGRKFLRHLGYFQPDYQHPFWYGEFLVHVFHYSTIISTKN